MVPSPLEVLDYARGLSQQGVEDYHMRPLSQQANARKELLELLDQFVEAAAHAQIVALLRSVRQIDVSEPHPGPLRSADPTRRSKAG